MKIGIIDDGRGASRALCVLARRLEFCGNQVVNPTYADIQPRATPEQIVKAAESRVHILRERQVNRVLVLIDKENRPECPGDWADTLRRTFRARGYKEVDVVVKNRQFENWIIADPGAFQRMAARFPRAVIIARVVRGDKADNVADPVALLERASATRAYHKTKDALALARHLLPLNMASNSRSFRRFLRLLGCQKYSGQSQRP